MESKVHILLKNMKDWAYKSYDDSFTITVYLCVLR